MGKCVGEHMMRLINSGFKNKEAIHPEAKVRNIIVLNLPISLSPSFFFFFFASRPIKQCWKTKRKAIIFGRE